MSHDPDGEKFRRHLGCRIVEQWTTCRRYADPQMRDAARRAFHDRWREFMEGGWVRLADADPAGLEAARKRVQELVPTHPDSIRVAELVARLVDVEGVMDEEHLFAALLDMEAHGHLRLASGWACRPPPRVPRRGTALEDMFLLLGFGAAREPYDGCG